MSAGVQSGSGQDFDLNIAPIIDCFTVLITYLLVSASFLSLSVLDIGVAANGVAAEPLVPTTPPVLVSLKLDVNKVGTYKVIGGPTNLDLSFPVQPGANGDWNTAGLITQVQQIREQWPAVTDVSVSADLSVRYKDIIKVLDPLKKTVPKIFLAGQ